MEKLTRIQKIVEWGRHNKDKRKIAKDKWRAKNKERTNFLTRQYNYRRKYNQGSVNFEEIKDLYNKFPICPYCQINKSDTIDHFIALSNGGSNEISNLIPVCRSCNSKKGAKSLWKIKPILAMMWDKIGEFN